MTPQQLRDRTKRFAVDVIRFCRTLPKTEEARELRRQLLRAGTSVGANYRAVCRARSDPEFISKMGTVIEETDETAYWIEILVAGEIIKPSAADRALWKEADELTRIFVSSRETVRRRLGRPLRRNA
jgi:four helix bundle protein